MYVLVILISPNKSSKPPGVDELSGNSRQSGKIFKHSDLRPSRTFNPALHPPEVDKARHQWNYYDSCSCDKMNLVFSANQKCTKRGNPIPPAPTTSIKLILDESFNLPTPFLTSDSSNDICSSSLNLGETSQITSIGHYFGPTAWPSQCFRSQHFLHSSFNVFVKAGFH